MITPVAISSIGYRYYIVYACIGICVSFAVYFYFPESMGRSLEEMDVLFSESTSIRSVVRSSLRRPQRDETRVCEALAEKKETVTECVESKS